MMKKVKTELNAKVNDIVNAMSLDQKISLMYGTPKFTDGMRGLIYDDDYHCKPFLAGAIPEHGIDGVRFIDGPRGVVLEGGATTFPVPMARGASFDTELERKIGRAIGEEHRAMGGNLFGGVCINLLRHPAWGRAQETYGEDPHLLGEMGAALTIGVQENVMACVKHFAANSIENARFQVDVTVSKRALHEVYLPHFKRVVEAGVACVMSAYNSLNGEWCGQSKTLLRNILKERWGFRGFVISDFVFGVRNAKLAVLAGQDIEMPFQMHYARFLRRLVQSAEVPESFVDEAARRILRQLLLFQDRPIPSKAVLACKQHISLARQSARCSFVMLKNGDELKATALPIAKTQTIAMFGELASTANLGDHGSSDGRPDYVVTPLEGIRAAVEDQSQVSFCDGSDLASAKKAASRADVAIVVVGYTHENEGEYIAPISMEPFADGVAPPAWLEPLFNNRPLAHLWRKLIGYASLKFGKKAAQRDGAAFGKGGDRHSLDLPEEHEVLIKEIAKENPNTIVLIMAGSAVTMERWEDDVSSIMMIWYPGMEGGNAVADIIFGDVSPSGRLPFSIPRSTSHLPEFDSNAETIEYGLWHGYKKLALEGNSAAYPFGYGLGYVDIAVDKLTASQQRFDGFTAMMVSVDLRCRVSNEGGMAADGVWQLYYSPPSGKVQRAVRSLLKFGRVALAANETQTIAIEVALKDMAYFDEQQDDFVLEKGDYTLFIAQHAEAEASCSVVISITS